MRQELGLLLVNSVVIYAFLASYGFRLLKQSYIFGPWFTLKAEVSGVVQYLATYIKQIPLAKNTISSLCDDALKDMTKSIAPKVEGETRYTELPLNGLPEAKVKAELQRYKAKEHIDWTKGRISGTIYHGGVALSKLIHESYALFSHANPLHPDIFPGVRQMEAEIITMCLKMYNANLSTACGGTTGGGTESILMACKSARDWSEATKGITAPEMVVPITAHAAFDKAAHYFKIKIIHVPMISDEDGRVDTAAMKSAITSNTVLLAGSAPSFPHGTIDDIKTIASLGLQYNIPVHVDCCLGSFLIPHMELAGYPIEPVDFRVPGVTSISCDTHKYGFAPKGSSVIMYSRKELRNHQYFVAPDWPGGVYASPGVAGSRPGALIAGCWTALLRTGQSGYVEATQKIIGAVRKIQQGIQEIPELQIVGRPEVSVIAFKSNQISIYAIADEMSHKGWNLNILQYPSAIHICVTLLSANFVHDFLEDLTNAVDTVKNNPDKKNKGGAAIYGMAASIPDRAVVGDLARGFLDILNDA